MKVNDLKIKLYTMMGIKKELDPFIEEVFNSYIKENNINFSNPDNWDMEQDGVLFSGYDCCHGVSESKTVKIPMDYVENYNRQGK